MLNTSTYLRNATPLLNRPVTRVELQRPLLHETHLTITPYLDEGIRPRNRVPPGSGSGARERAESLMLAPIWVGSATVVLAALAELLRSV